MSTSLVLDDSEEHFRLLAEHSGDVILEVALDTTITWVSPSAREVMAWEPKDLIGLHTVDIVHPDCLDDFRAMATRALGSGEETQITLLTRRGDGTYHWMEARGRQAPATEARPGFRVVRLRDVHAQRLAEEALQESEARLRRTLDTMLEPFVLLRAMRDAHGTVVDFEFADANAAALAVYEMPREALLGRRLLELHGNAVSTGLFAMYVDVVEEGRTMVLDDWPYPQEIRGGRVLRYNVRAVRVGDAVSQVWWEVTDRYEAQQRLVAESEERYRLLADNARDVVMRTDSEQRIEWVSTSASVTMGWLPAQLIGRSALELVHPEHGEFIAALADADRTGTSSVDVTLRILQADGTYRWMDIHSHFVEGADRTFRITRLQDVHDRHRAEQQLAASEQRYRLLAEHASDVVWNVDERGWIDWASESSKSLLGWESAELVGTDCQQLIHVDDRERARQTLESSMISGRGSCICRMLRKDGTWLWVSRSAHVSSGRDSRARVVTMRDIDAEVKARQELDRALGHDPLTGLPNRLALLDQLDAALRRGADARAVCVMIIGIDGVAAINEAFTYAAGDIVLTTVAARIAEIAPPGSLLGRGASADFILVVPGLADQGEATALGDAIRAAMITGVQTAEAQVRPTLSIGITFARTDSTSGTLLAEADAALRRAKDAGHDRASVAAPDEPERIRHRLAIEESVREALDEQRIEQWYQPIVEIASRRVVGYESLMRLRLEDGSVMLPGEFIPMLEHSSLMCALDLCAIEQSLAQLTRLDPRLWISVNLSARTLGDAQHCERVIDLIDEAGPVAERLHVELTETAILGGAGVQLAMRRIAATGAKWYLDDFGTGFSSISHLRDLPLAGLKLDVSFTRSIREGEARGTRVGQALAGLAKGLGLMTIAEGVEYAPEAEALLAQGWQYGQGWLYGHAAPFA